MPSGEVMHKFKRGQLHSGSKHGPVVTNPAQAKAIASSEREQEQLDKARVARLKQYQRK